MTNTKISNFQVTILFSNGEPLHKEANTIKEVRNLMRFERSRAKAWGYPKGVVRQAHIHPQTSVGKRMLHKNWAAMNPCGKVFHYYRLHESVLETV